MIRLAKPRAVLALIVATAACAESPIAAAGDADVAADRPVAQGGARVAPRAVSPLPLAGPSTSAWRHSAYQRIEGNWMPILFLCDGVEGKVVQLITAPYANGTSLLWTYRKAGFRTSRRIVRIGPEDPGAGQVYRAIAAPEGGDLGSVHSINPGIRGDPIATTLPTLSSITVGATATRCRWLQEARLQLVTSRRSVVVTRDSDGRYTYRSFDYARPGKVYGSGSAVSSTPTTTIRGGRLASSSKGRETYVFQRSPWRYQVAASADNRAPGATLTVARNGKVVQVETAAAYQMAAERIE